MFEARLRRRKCWDRSGVSEVVGTILTLSITVVLFSTVIAMVNTFPAPGDNVFTDFNATVEPRVDDWSAGAYVHVTNVGGEVMDFLSTRVILTVDNNTYTLRTKGSLNNRTYGVGPMVPGHKGPDNGNDDWDTGETWTVLFDNGTAIYQINKHSNVGVMIIDVLRNAMVWTSTVRGKANMFGPVIRDIWVDSDTRTIRHDPVQYGREFFLYAEVSDSDGDLNPNSVFADLSAINPALKSVQLFDNDTDGVYVSDGLQGPSTGSIPVGYHVALIYAEDLATPTHSGRGVGRIPVGQDLGGQPNLVIFEQDLEVSSKTPVNGQTVLITATIKNFGGFCNGVLTFYDVVGSITDVIETVNFTISNAPDQVTKSVAWTASPGGAHTLVAEALPIDATDYFVYDNSNYTNITVMPKILLVDDDDHVSDMSAYDTVSYMRAGLEQSNFDYDLYMVGTQKNGPGYQYGQTRMMNYDVVIWMCGYEDTYTLTVPDQENLTAYLNDAAGMGRAGSLWLVGQHILEDPVVSATFITNELMVSIVSAPVSPVPTDPLMGVAGNEISDDWASDFIPIIDRVPGNNQSCWIRPNIAAGANITFMVPPPDDQWAYALNYEDLALDERLVFFPWEFSRIEKTSDQTQVVYKVLMWLANITIVFGNDLAISEQIVEPSYVFYNELVNVTAIIRNNGAEDLTTDAVLFLDGQPLVNTFWFNINVSKTGGTATIWAEWTADVLGKHVLKWKVDPDNHIVETNEANNMIPSYVTTGEVYVEFRILVVDDDYSANNGGGQPDETSFVTDSLARLGYSYESPYGVNTTYVVNGTGDGPPMNVIEDYSAVIWVTGMASSGLRFADNTSLSNYLRNCNGRLWLLGQDLWSGIPGANLSATCGISGVIANQGLDTYLVGLDNSSISHGMRVPVINAANVDTLVPGPRAEGVFYQNESSGDFCALRLYNTDYKALTCAFTFSMLFGSEDYLVSGTNAIDEITYLILHSFERPEDRKELRITLSDFSINNPHPQIGGAYIIRARVHNVGGTTANVLLRFMDGSTQMGADSISVSPDTSTSAEIIWKPLFAGERAIHILVDPVGEVNEIFEWFNNNITTHLYVYFFWDDMESGADKWSHSSTIINVNGEGPLDYYSSYTVLDTDISSQWDYSESFGVINTTKYAHSYPQSFWMEEGEGLFGKADVLISFAIDDSRSMWQRYSDADPTKTWLDMAKEATLTLLDTLSDDSVVVSVWDFSGGGERRFSGPNQTVGGGRSATDNATITQYARPPIRLGDMFNSTINGTLIDGRQYIRDEIVLMDNPSGQTVIWDSIGEAYLDTMWFAPNYTELMPVVIVLSDGADLQAADHSSPQLQKIESGSNYWCPWDDEVNGTQYYPIHRGKYTLDVMNDPLGTTQWVEALGHGGSVIRDRVGLLNADLKIFTIGLGLEHHDNPATPDVMEVWQPQISMWPGEVHDNSNAVCTDTTISPPCDETGTMEYNLWRIANTTGAQYFYAPDADDLEDIFIQLGMLLVQGFNQTRGIEPMNPQLVHNNTDKRAVTETFSLEGVSNAKLSFWHKYNILQGGNGAFLQVAYKTSSTGDWLYKYIIPPGQYTGGLYYIENIYDDFGNLVKWCWNGLSGSGSMAWDYAEVDISPFVPEGAAFDGHVYRSQVKVAFNYTQFGGGSGVGWYLDDVRLDISRDPAATIGPGTKDLWSLDTLEAHSGTHSWSNIDPVTGNVTTGIDNSLVTSPIDLTNARTAYISAYLKFNFNQASGAPPDGFRIEISTNNGISWGAINLGVRSSWGVSGMGSDADDGNLSDGKSHKGLPDSGNAAADEYWISMGTLARVNMDLSAWRGNQILIRFRLVTNNVPTMFYAHNNNLNDGYPGFGGFYVDDVIVYGETIFG